MIFQYRILEFRDIANVTTAPRGKQDIDFSLHFTEESFPSTKRKG